MVKRSVKIGQPIIFAMMNYQVNEREGLRWIKKYISTFGGHPNRVTIWGTSSSDGVFAVGAQLVTNGDDDEGLFHAAVMSCGSLLPTGDTANQQSSFDGVVEHAVMPLWFPRADGIFIKEPVRDAVLAGRIADVPFMVGTSLDEGTLFVTGAWSVEHHVRASFFNPTSPWHHWQTRTRFHSTDDDFLDYMLDRFFPGASNEEVAPLIDLCPNVPAQGSPFGTGDTN
ncbi:hypothetical protein GSI_13378 [Ganoderma sinense ZZ0214-1]|uniref:Carboxylesterase type B domain-containing protein n=1 Tax=Ganoderma sinense ZZ0214-1 TaxID=1077348 RepID=A0A2G8RVY1_9APHY|nr:hypothetical protein GSI_13378 [Ganoderma sinense ZZ0214-1]